VTVLSPITNSTAAVELELQEDEGLKGLRRSGVSTIEFWKNVPEEKHPSITK